MIVTMSIKCPNGFEHVDPCMNIQQRSLALEFLQLDLHTQHPTDQNSARCGDIDLRFLLLLHCLLLPVMFFRLSL